MFGALLVLLFTVAGLVQGHDLFDNNNDIVKLTSSNFESQVTSSKGLWIVMFYANWCGHCKNFAPEFAKVAKKFHGLVAFGVVDGDTENALAGKYEIKGFPTLKTFGKDKRNPKDFDGARTADAVAKKIVEMMQNANGDDSKGSPKNSVVVLTDDNFDEIVGKSEKPVLVKFFAPWCGHCKSMESDYIAAADEVKKRVVLGEVDATVHTKLSQRFGVRGYPTLRYFTKDNGETGEEYTGGRTKEGIIEWLENKVGPLSEKPQVRQVLSQKCFEDCLSKTLCVLAFLPMEEDTNAVERKKHILLLEEVMKKSNTGTWGWYWTIGGSNEKLEEALAIDGLSYPFFIGIYKSKNAFTVLKSAFTSSQMVDFIHEVKNGKTTYSTLPKVLAPFKNAEPFVKPQDEL